jgi:hypothetical protein
MRRQNITILMLLTNLFLVTSLLAQDFSQTTIRNNYNGLKKSDADNKTNRADDEFDDQIKSIVKLFSSLVGSGFVNTASLHKIGGLDVGARGVITAIPDEFKSIVPDDIKRKYGVTDPLSGTKTVPIPFLHASLGLPGNLEIMGKFISFKVADKPDGNITLLGGAVKYGLLRGNAGLPAITLLGGYQTVIVPQDYAFGNVSTFSLKGYISKSFLIATLYGGGGIDRTNLKIDIPGLITRDYEVTYPSFTVGATITPFPLVKVNADYNHGEVKNITVGVGVSIR